MQSKREQHFHGEGADENGDAEVNVIVASCFFANLVHITNY